MFISPVYASGGPGGLASFEPFILLGVFAIVFYFFLWRPQAKRTKAHKELLAALKKGDEVVTAGGVAGEVLAISDSFVMLKIDANAKLKVQKASVASLLPKGTLGSIKE